MTLPNTLPTIDLNNPSLYINRELSWLDFNARVLEEALDKTKPLLERVRFLGIFSTNLDEFFMIRVASLRKQYHAGVGETSIDGLTPLEQLEAIYQRVIPLKGKQIQCWLEDVLPNLEPHGIRIYSHHELTQSQRKVLRAYFQKEILPVLTPLAVDPGRPFPHISNLSLNLAIRLQDQWGSEHFARLKVPTTEKFPRFLHLNTICAQYNTDPLNYPYSFLYIEELIQVNLDLLFPGMSIIETYPFRVIRDADVEIAEDEASDLLETIEEGVRQRRFGEVVMLIVTPAMSKNIRTMLMKHLLLEPRDVYELTSPLGLNDLFEIVDLDLPHLKHPKFVPARSPFFPPETDIFASIRQEDVLMVHPYESFDPTVDFIRTAAKDPDVLAIKISLYRVGPNSPIVDALLEARDNGKQVAALVELKARFDEQNNITWARALDATGAHVVYGLMGLKTHAKIALVVRREGHTIRRYVHMSTGNYNAHTARVYSDIGFFTVREDIADDLTQLFNRITGFAPNARYHKLLVAPEYFRAEMMTLLEREIQHARAGRPARMIIKLNSLTDARMIRKFYEASQAGVKIDAIIRGICCLRPGIPGISENIQVRSIVGRFLEHARVYWFDNGGQPEAYLGSADLMERNLNRRVEQVFPIETAIWKHFLKNMLEWQLRDNAQARLLKADGSWTRLYPQDGDPLIDSQMIFLDYREQLLNLPPVETL